MNAELKLQAPIIQSLFSLLGHMTHDQTKLAKNIVFVLVLDIVIHQENGEYLCVSDCILYVNVVSNQITKKHY